MSRWKDEPMPVKVPDRSRTVSKRLIEELAKALVAATGNDNRESAFNDHIGTDKVRFSTNIPLWQLASVGYNIMKMVTPESQMMDFNDGNMIPASMDTLEYKRGTSITALVEGYLFTHHNDLPVIIGITRGNSVYVNVSGPKSREKEVEAFFDHFKKNVCTLDMLKGEKMLITSRNNFRFLEYDKIKREDIILDSCVWEKLDRDFFFVINNREKMEGSNLQWKRGLLIWGPPGTGKTLFGKLLCNETDGMTVLWVTPRCVEDGDDINKIFEMARLLSPTVIFVEDLDFFAADRDEYGYNYILGELLTQLDGISPNDGIFVIGTTNNPMALDDAIGNRPARFDVKISFPLPAEPERDIMYRKFLQGKEVDYSKLSRYSDNMTGSHIKETCIRGTLKKLRDPDVNLTDAIAEAIQELKEENFKDLPAPKGLYG